jgi:hypothetical protein
MTLADTLGLQAWLLVACGIALGTVATLTITSWRARRSEA